MSDREARIAVLAKANQDRTKAKRESIAVAIKDLIKAGHAVNVNSVAKKAGVSRGFVYGQEDLLEAIKTATNEAAHRLIKPAKGATDESLRKRLANALDSLEEAKVRIAEQERRIERLTGEVARLQAQ